MSFKLLAFNCHLDANMLVADLINKNSVRWKTELLENNVDNGDMEIIKSILISIQDRDDELVWHYTSHGIYAIKSSYHIALHRKRTAFNRGDLSQANNPLWKIIWGLQVPLKV